VKSVAKISCDECNEVIQSGLCLFALSNKINPAAAGSLETLQKRAAFLANKKASITGGFQAV
jgi:hypothetical protein